MCHGQIINDALLKARKEHRCDECRKTIASGRLYQRYRWVELHEDPQTVKLCERCSALTSISMQDSDGADACYELGTIRGNMRHVGASSGWWQALRARIRERIVLSRKLYRTG
jgi:hypothetical protein